MRAHAGLDVRLREVDSTAAALAILSRGADVAICAGLVEDDEVVARQLGAVHYVTCATPERIERDGVPDHPAELDPATCIGILEPHTDRARDWQFQKRRFRYTLPPSGSLAFNDTGTAVASAVRGGGYVRVLSVAVAREVGAGLLRPVLEDWSDAGLPFCVVRSRARALDEDLSAFTDFVAELVPNTDDDCAVRPDFGPAQRGSLTRDNRVSKRRP